MDTLLIEEIKNVYLNNINKKFMVHNGFDGWVYGSPKNPILITFDTVIKLIDYVVENRTDSSYTLK